MQPRIRFPGAAPSAAIVAMLALAAGCGPGPGEAGASPEAAAAPEAAQPRGGPADHGSGQAVDAGAAWAGTVDVRVTPATGTQVQRTDSGSGSARFVEEDGARTQLAVVGSIRPPADAGFVIAGTDDGAGWTGRHGDVMLTLGPDGRVDGGGVVDGQRLGFEGFVTPERFELTVDLELLEDAAGGMPAGTRFVFHYDLGRRQPDAEADEGGSRRDRQRERDCPRTVWRFRNVPSLSGGSMQLIQVPECVG